jgi:hypothetical protein
LAGFAETEQSVHFDPEFARRQAELVELIEGQSPPHDRAHPV